MREKSSSFFGYVKTMSESSDMKWQQPDDGDSLSLHEKLEKAKLFLSSDTCNDSALLSKTIIELEALQKDVHRASLFSTNETLQDISTPTLSLLSTEYHLGKASLQILTDTSLQRKKMLERATEYFYIFLGRCDGYDSCSDRNQDYGLLKDAIKKEYHDLLDLEENANSENDENDESCNHSISNTLAPQMNAGRSREAKIERFRLVKSIEKARVHLRAQQSQRKRLRLGENEHLDGYDDESLTRSMTLIELNLYAIQSVEEIYNCAREMEMVKIAIEREKLKPLDTFQNRIKGHIHDDPSEIKPRNSTSNLMPEKPMVVTRVTTNPNTGKLMMKREQVRSELYRPSWNQPTMSLDELAKIEYADAMQREEQQKKSEKDAHQQPRRYEQLLRDGMEDDANLVDDSADLDQKWDDWKDEHPRGSGNKMGDRGDRNF